MTEPETSVPRLRSVRMKHGGATVRVLYPQADTDRAYIERLVRATLDSHADALAHDPGQTNAGFAFIVWNEEGAATCIMRASPKSRIPTVLAPDFIRNRLRDEHGAHWVADLYGLDRDSAPGGYRG